MSANIGSKSSPLPPARAASARAVSHVPSCSSTSPDIATVKVRGSGSAVGSVVVLSPGVGPDGLGDATLGRARRLARDGLGAGSAVSSPLHPPASSSAATTAAAYGPLTRRTGTPHSA